MISEFYHIVSKNIKFFHYDYGGSKELRFDSDVFSEVKDFCDKNTIHYEKKVGQLCIEKAKIPFAFFIDIEEFLQEADSKDLEKGLILNLNNGLTPFYYDQGSLTGLEESIDPRYKYLIENSKLYFRFKKFLKDNSEAENGNFEFTDSYSISSRKIILSDAKGKKKLVFKFNQKGVPSDIFFQNNYTPSYESFTLLFQDNRQFPVFLKESVLNIVRLNEGSFFSSFFQNLNQINQEAQLNFGIFIHELSLEKIKRGYNDYKQQYFSKQNEILSKTSTQVLSLPISIAGTLFAISKLNDSLVAVTLVCIGLTAYMLFSLFVSHLYFQDLRNIGKQLIREYEIMKSEPFFDEHPDELEFFQEIKSELSDRLNNLIFAVKSYASISFFSTICILFYVCYLFKSALRPTDYLIFLIAFGIYYIVISKVLLFKKV